jgi:hypothetical protein
MTDTLPRAIADLVGIVFGEPKKPKPAPINAPRPSPISMVENGDGTYTVLRFRKVVGWINPVHLAGDRDGFKALTVHGEIKNCYSMRLAREFLLSSYH